MAGALLNRSFLSLSRSNHSRTSSSLSPPYDIEAHLKKAIPVRQPNSVFEPMHHLTLDAPKTTAAALCIAACELVGGSRDDAINAASAIHLMHASAYTHENLPLTDRIKARPTIQHKFGPNIELLTGDGMIPYGLELLARSTNSAENNSDNKLRVIIEITRAVGSQGVVNGQYQEVELEQSNGLESPDVSRIEYICEKKEGTLHACGAACGAILGGGSEEEIDKLRRYGLYVGMIQGMLYGVGKSEGGKMEIAEKWRVLALKESEHFDSRKIEQISRLLDSNFCNV